jgi:hypothetical protein
MNINKKINTLFSSVLILVLFCLIFLVSYMALFLPIE